MFIVETKTSDGKTWKWEEATLSVALKKQNRQTATGFSISKDGLIANGVDKDVHRMSYNAHQIRSCAVIVKDDDKSIMDEVKDLLS